MTMEERLESAGDRGGKADGQNSVFREGARLSSSKGGRNRRVLDAVVQHA